MFEQAGSSSSSSKLYIAALVTAVLVFVSGGLIYTVNLNQAPILPVDPLGRARLIMEKNLVFDGHNDLPWKYRGIAQNQVQPSPIHLQSVQPSLGLHTDIPKIRSGLLTGQFWSVYTDCSRNDKDALRVTLEQIDVMQRVIDNYPETFQLALTADDVEAAFAAGKVASMFGMEGGHSIDSSLAALRTLYTVGARYMTLTHNCNLPWVDSCCANGFPNNGLSDFGQLVIREMNRIGMIVDLSHVSDKVMRDVLTMSPAVAPLIFSHSNVKTLCNHPRNAPDDVLQLLRLNGGILMINFYSAFINCQSGTTNTTVDSVVEHIQYVVNLIGIDHVALGADYDGVNALPQGLGDVSTYPILIARLLELGWSDENVIKFIGGNFMRVFRGVEAYKRAQASMLPIQDLIDPNHPAIINNVCRTRYSLNEKTACDSEPSEKEPGDVTVASPNAKGPISAY